LVKASSLFQKDDVLVEPVCENEEKDVDECHTANHAMKGIAVRSFARAALFAPFISDSIATMLNASAKAAASACDGANCSLAWADKNSQLESGSASHGYWREVFSALEVVQSLLYQSGKGLKNVNGTASGSGSNEDSTQKENASGTAGADAPQKTGAANTVAGSVTVVLAVAFAAALGC
jgi:mannan endo-1,6-alpha-mannosidase